eukprot:COSAG02_NODE_1256_length_13576_cov_12.901981_2_plen_158_part_00
MATTKMFSAEGRTSPDKVATYMELVNTRTWREKIGARRKMEAAKESEVLRKARLGAFRWWRQCRVTTRHMPSKHSQCGTQTRHAAKELEQIIESIESETDGLLLLDNLTFGQPYFWTIRCSTHSKAAAVFLKVCCFATLSSLYLITISRSFVVSSTF